MAKCKTTTTVTCRTTIELDQDDIEALLKDQYRYIEGKAEVYIDCGQVLRATVTIIKEIEE